MLLRWLGGRKGIKKGNPLTHVVTDSGPPSNWSCELVAANDARGRLILCSGTLESSVLDRTRFLVLGVEVIAQRVKLECANTLYMHRCLTVVLQNGESTGG